MIARESLSRFKGIEFDVTVSQGAVFNFVYNYATMDSFMAARIEGRISNGRGYDNGRLQCTKWRIWHVTDRYTPESEPDPAKQNHQVKVNLEPSDKFAVVVDGKPLVFENGADWSYDPSLRIGFMTEAGLVSISDLQFL